MDMQYSSAFTAAPIVEYSMLDIQYDKERFMQDPQLYRIGIENRCFNTKTFWGWFIYGLYHSVIVFYLCFYCQEQSPFTGSIWLSGNLVMGGVVLLVNMKILDRYYLYAVRPIIPIGISILLFVLLFLLTNTVFWDNPILLGLFAPTFKNGVTYFALLMCFAQPFTIDKIINRIANRVDDYLY